MAEPTTREDPRIWAPALAFAMTVAIFWPLTRYGLADWAEQPAGRNPFFYYAIVILLHAGNAALCAAVSAQILRRAWDCPRQDPRPEWWACAGALLFSAHPLCVEAVALGPDILLGGAFFLTSVLFYLNGYFETSVLAGVAAAYCSRTAASLPLLLLLLDFHPLRRMRFEARFWAVPQARRALLEKLPFLVAVLAAAAFSPHAPPGGGSALAVQRCLLGLEKIFWPTGLAPGATISHGPLAWRFWASATVLAAATTALPFLRRPWALAAWLAYGLFVLPGPQIPADRYAYLCILPWAVLVAAGLAALAGHSRGRLFGALAAAVLLVGLLFGLTRWQILSWRDPETLWTRAITTRPESSLAHERLGEAYLRQGRLKEAWLQFRQALRRNPNDAFAAYGLGQVYAAAGATAPAAGLFRNAIRLDPRPLPPYNDLGTLLFASGRYQEAAAVFRQALARDSDPSPAARSERAGLCNNLGNTLLAAGDAAGALRSYAEAIRLTPQDPRAHFNSGLAWLRLGRPDKAAPRFAETLRLDPAFPKARLNLDQARSGRVRSRASGSRTSR